VKVIGNARNFGHVRSPMHALLQARGDAYIPFHIDSSPEPAPPLTPNYENRDRQPNRNTISLSNALDGRE